MKGDGDITPSPSDGVAGAGEGAGVLLSRPLERSRDLPIGDLWKA